ncbi:MAG: bifunctional YncE family protein/alkaline phosphatase family protein [Pyrinomonadaceae bacterium]
MKSFKLRANVFLAGIVLLSLVLVVVTPGPSSAEPVTIDQSLDLTPAGSLLMDSTTRQPAVGALTVAFVRTPDHSGPEGTGRYLIGVNSGYGVQFNAATNRGQQSLAVIDLIARPAPVVVQNVYFPSPQSVNVGLVFAPEPDQDGTYAMYASGGFENKIWIFTFDPHSRTPITPTSPGPNTAVGAPFIDVTGFSKAAPSPRYNAERAPVYPTGLSISPDGKTLFVANNLADSLGVVRDLRGSRKLETVSLVGHAARASAHFTYPYSALAIPVDRIRPRQLQPLKIYVSLWNDNSVAVVSFVDSQPRVSYVMVGHHPTAMIEDPHRHRLYVVNSDDDSVSVIDTDTDREVKRIDVRVSEAAPPGNSPEGLALDSEGKTLYVANAHSNSLAVIDLSFEKRAETGALGGVRGFIPTGKYPSAVTVVGSRLFVGNGKGTGVENSSVISNNSGQAPNTPNDRFPRGTGRAMAQGGQYSVSVVSGNISVINEPSDPQLAQYTQQTMRNNGLIKLSDPKQFQRPPIKHVIYIIKENRTYDQVFGDIESAGDGSHADGDSDLAILGNGEAAARFDGTRQQITPNHRALALRFGLFDRFFANSEASPDGHNWSTAAFSSDYVDKAFRWEYSRRGRGYDYEGFNRLPNYEPIRGARPLFERSVNAEDVANFMRQFVPYLHGSRDVAEPGTLYLWDAAARAGLTYRNYGEFIATISAADVAAIKTNRSKSYPDVTETVSAFPTKKTLEGHYSNAFRNFDLDTPDAMTVDSYRAAKESGAAPGAFITKTREEPLFNGVSRVGAWLEDFQGFVADREAGRPDRMPNLSVMRLPNDHTDGLRARAPTPQFYVADNDYAVGLLVEAVSSSPYWKDTAIFIVEDDAQDGPDHVDAHRTVALVISAYNRPGVLVHDIHTTVSMIRTIELLLDMSPMNQLDATAVPIDVFRSEADLRPYHALFPNVSLLNLTTPPPRDSVTAYWMKKTEEQDLSHADMADPQILNHIIWASVRGRVSMPQVSRLPAFDALRLGLKVQNEELARGDKEDLGR